MQGELQCVYEPQSIQPLERLMRRMKMHAGRTAVGGMSPPSDAAKWARVPTDARGNGMLVEGVSHEPQCDTDGLTHQHQQQQNGAYYLSARPTHLPHLPLAAFSWIDRPRHNRLPSRLCFEDNKCLLSPEALGKTSWFRLEVEAHFGRKRSRSHVVCSAERRQEVVKRVLVCDIHSRQAQTPSIPVTPEDVVFANGSVEEIAWCNALWVLVVVSGVRGRDIDQMGGQLRCRADARKRSEGSSPDPVADKTSLSLLISGERLAECADHRDSRLPIQRGGGDKAGAVRVCNTVTGSVTSHQAAVIAPIETDPGPEIPRSGELILHMRGLIKPFVMVDAEGIAGLADGRAGSGDLGREESGGDRRHHHKRT